MGGEGGIWAMSLPAKGLTSKFVSRVSLELSWSWSCGVVKEKKMAEFRASLPTGSREVGEECGGRGSSSVVEEKVVKCNAW